MSAFLAFTACGSGAGRQQAEAVAPPLTPRSQRLRSEAASCRVLARTEAPAIVTRVLGATAVAFLESRSFGEREDPEGRPSLSWFATIETPVERKALLHALRAEDEDHLLRARRNDDLGLSIYGATWSEGGRHWGVTLGFSDGEDPSITVYCADPELTSMDWTTARQSELVTDVVPPEMEPALANARLANIGASHDSWSAHVDGASLTRLRRDLEAAGWQFRVGETTWMFARDGRDILIEILDQGWSLNIHRPESPRPRICVDDDDQEDRIRLYLVVNARNYLLAGTDGTHIEIANEAQLQRAVRERRHQDPSLHYLIVRTALPPSEPRLQRAWSLVLEENVNPLYCTEERDAQGRPRGDVLASLTGSWGD